MNGENDSARDTGIEPEEEVINEASMEAAIQRLDRLERENRRMKRAGRSRTAKRGSR